jgi:hypothetical protein
MLPRSLRYVPQTARLSGRDDGFVEQLSFEMA